MFNVPQSHVHGDKFKDKFDRPFDIHDIVRSGTYKLRTIDGRVRKNPVHADLLKPYLKRSNGYNKSSLVDKFLINIGLVRTLTTLFYQN